MTGEAGGEHELYVLDHSSRAWKILISPVKSIDFVLSIDNMQKLLFVELVLKASFGTIAAESFLL